MNCKWSCICQGLETGVEVSVGAESKAMLACGVKEQWEEKGMRPSSEWIFSLSVPVATLTGKSGTIFLRDYQYNASYMGAEGKRISQNHFSFNLWSVWFQMKLVPSVAPPSPAPSSLYTCATARRCCIGLVSLQSWQQSRVSSQLCRASLCFVLQGPDTPLVGRNFMCMCVSFV